MGCRTSQDRLHPDHFGRGAELPEACNDLLTSRAGQIAGEAERPHWSTYSFGRFMRRMPAGSREGSFLSALNRIEKDLNNISRSLLNLERILKQRRRVRWTVFFVVFIVKHRSMSTDTRFLSLSSITLETNHFVLSVNHKCLQ